MVGTALISGLQANDDVAKDNIEHPIMLYSRSCNSNGDKVDGIFGRDRGVTAWPDRGSCLVVPSPDQKNVSDSHSLWRVFL